MQGTGFLEAVWKQAPKSSRQRYAKRASSKVDITSKGALPSGWRKQLSPKTLERVDATGQQRLAKSLMPQGGPQLREDAGEVRYIIESTVPYASFVHNAEKPRPGAYWDGSRRGGGWSTPGTGPRYLDEPLEKYEDRMKKAVTDGIDGVLKEAGLL